MEKNQYLFNTLQREFCPPLDSSLVAAFFADLGSGAVSNTQINGLRATLQELASQADMESQLCEISDLQLPSPTDTSSTSYFHHNDSTTSPSSLSSSISQSSTNTPGSPLAFLRAALPHVSMQTLRSALKDSDRDDIDMWDVVAGILTVESIREMEERGLEKLEDDDLPDAAQTQVEERRGSGLKKTASKKRGQQKSIALILGDVRQQNQARPVAKAIRNVGPVDPWTQLSSLSSHLATLLPPHQPSFFQSYFHSPEYPTPYLALRACLAFISKSSARFSPEPPENHIDTIFILLDILCPEYPSLNYEQYDRLVSDIELAMQATSVDSCVDLVKLLRELDADAKGFLEMGIYHSPLPVAAIQKQQNRPSFVPRLSQPSSHSQPRTKPPPSPSDDQPGASEWQYVPKRRPPKGPHPLAAHIPAYQDNHWKTGVKGAGNTFGQGGRGDVGELQEHRQRIRENMRKRNDLLRQATWMWQRGNSKNRGGEVAMYFAERARQSQESMREESLHAARMIVESKRLRSSDSSIVDLHGTTVSEATIIVMEILETEGCSPGRPLKIITGRGLHSRNNVNVLKPAIRKALVEDGWSVSYWEGGLIVNGKR